MSTKKLIKALGLIIVVALLAAVPLQAKAQAAAVVTTEAGLREALADPSVTQIELGASFALSATVDVNRSVAIDGKDFTITGPAKGTEAWEGHGLVVTANNVSISNLTITGSGRSNLVFYNVTGGSATYVILSNAAHAGMIVNSSEVTISNVTTTNNTWGGINVDQGSGLTTTPLLIVQNVTRHTSPTAGVTPAIWVDKGNPAWVTVGDLYTVVTPPNGFLVFYDNTEFATIAANFPIHNENLDIYYATIQEAINAATPGDTITVNGTHVLTSVVNVNKAVTLTCATGAKIQVSGTGDRFDVSAAATIQNCEIEKTDEVGQQDIIRLRASGITIQNNTIWGYWDKADLSYVSRAMIFNAGAFSDILITGNEIYGLRQPAYISGTHTGTISNNYVHGTKGWVLEGGNLTFTDNTWADNVGDIAILSACPAAYYTDIVAMSAANNGAVIEDQRMSPALLSVVYVDDSAAAGGNGTQATPYQTIQDGIDRVIPGGTVHVAAGDYSIPSTMTLAKAITVSGPTTGEAKLIKADGITTNNIFLITASDVTIQNLTLTLNGAPTKGDAFIQAPDGAKANIQILNNKIYVGAQAGPMTGWQAQAIYFGRYTTNSKINNNTIYNTRSGAVAHYNCEVEYRDNVIYNTKGGIMNYASDAVNALERVMVNNSWGTVHNEWDIIWNSGAGVWDFDEIDLVLQMSQENNDAYVVTLVGTAPILGNRSHVFVNAVTGTETLHPANGNMNLPYKKIQDAIDAVVPGGKVIVAGGDYTEELRIDKSVTLLGPNADINPNTGDRVDEAIIKSTVDGAVITQVTGVSIKGFTFDGQGTSDSGIYSYDGPGSVIIENNILKNHDYGALVFYNYYNSGNATVNNVIKNNKIETVTGEYGLGILLYNNFYAEVSGNVISDVRVGIQTGNYYRSNTGTPATLNSNQITAHRRGIFHNLHYSDASTFTITGNTITAQDLVTGTTFDGIMLSSIQNAVDAVVTDNTITVGEITQAPTSGYMIWNNPTTATLSVEGGSVTGADYGVFFNNFEGYSSDALSTAVTIDGVTITGAEIGVYVKDSPDNTNSATVSAILTDNVITATTGIKVEGADATATGDHNQVYATTDVENTNLVSMNFENNYWGSPCGATVVGVVDTIPWFEDAAMLVSKDTNPSGNLTLTPPMTTLEINNTLACAAPYSTITFNAGTVDYPGDIIIPEGRDHLTIVLADGVKINANSPCITVNADYTTIEAENIGMAACVTVAGSNGIDVADGVVNLTVDGLEIYGAGNDGIHFNGVITDVVLKDNFIHDLAGNGVFFGAQPVAQTVGAIDIHGNMFQNNGGNGIEAGAYTVPAEYNSWGNVAGAAAGDGASSGVDADPFTHVDLYLESSGTPWANQVVSGQTITYTVMGHLVNANAADFVLAYPANLTYVSSTAGTPFGVDNVTHNAGTRTLHFLGYSISGNKSGTLPMFSVTFTAGDPIVNAPMLLDELTDGFGMVGVGSSSNIYAAALLDSTVTIVTLPTITSTDIQGYYLSGEQREFSVVLDNPSTGADYAHVYVDFTMTNAQVEQISLIEYSVDNGTNWVALGTGPGTSFANSGTDIVGYFGKVTGGGFALAPNTSLTTLFRVTFVTRDAAVDLPTSYAVSMKLMDADALPAAVQLDDFAATMQVYDKPTVTYTSDPYFIIGEAGNFAVTITNPVTGKNYLNTVVFDVVLQNHLVSDISAISCTDGTTTWDLIGALTPDGSNVKARIGGLDGFFTIPAPLTVTLPCTVTYATAGTYTTSTSMVDVVSPLPERVVSADIPGTATVYAKPVITPTNLGGPFDAGLPETVSLSIANTSIPEPFEVVFSYPAGTVIVYNSVTYTCAATCPVIPVELTAEPTVLDFTVTFDEAWTGDVSVSLFDSDWTPADRLLASASATGAVVNGNFNVTGTFSMQGRATRAGIPVTLTWSGTFATYGPTANTIEAISNNFSQTVTYGGYYTITTNQPRYLNVYADVSFSKIINVHADYPLPALQLRAGNAVWTDNEIDLDDASKVGADWGSVLNPDGNVNFDSIVNIQDLALVGGNYSLTSTTAYASWLP